MNIIGMSEQWVAARIQQKGDGKCIPWASLRDLISAHPDVKRKVDVLALSIYSLEIFPKALRHIDEAITDLFDRLGKQVKPVPAILAEMFRSLSACRRAGEGRFIGCARLLLIWFHSHFWRVDKVPYRVFFESYSPLKEATFTPRRDDISEESCWICTVARTKAIQSKAVHTGSMTTLEYKGWLSKRINDNIPGPSLEGARLMEEYLRAVPSELEIIKQDFERKILELRNRIDKLEEEKMHLRLAVDV
ncbi:Pentatricopeptide repeat-containing-like protein [Gossypium australe]|uniref:Pentatricopeptide repeat-containing-like protein n=1 Tax=Gossypium australe TaxID=47621 RepID=A0A5B6X2P9_9ROSI|nr:Pentatricopeptide repeat-containing-like protein [Gossypium australe]